MKVAFITDTHRGIRNSSDVFADYQATFYKDVFFPELIKRGVTRIIHGGDYFDHRTQISTKAMLRDRVDFLDHLVDHGMTMELLVGNHDVSYRSTNELNSPELLFRGYDNISVYTSPITLDCGIDLIPWINKTNADDVQSFVDNSDSQICFGHFDFGGFEMYRGVKSEHGMSTKGYQDYKQVFSGHFHTRSSHGNITYLGSPFEFNWSDYNDPRGFHIFDTETHELEFIQNPYRMFHKFVYEGTHYDVNEPMAGKYIKVIAKTNSDLTPFCEQFSSAYDLQIIESSASEEAGDLDTDIVHKNTMDYINQYIDASSISTNKDFLKNLMYEIYVEASQHD